MTTVMDFAALDTLPRIGLADLEERAALQTRVDRKYVMPLAAAGLLLETLAPHAVALEINGIRQFAYESLYFDTPELSGFHRTAHRHRRRFKVRTRTYVDSGSCWLEVKVPGPRGSTVKYRAPHDREQQHTVAAGRAFVDDVFGRHGLPAGDHVVLASALRTEYLRFTLLLADTDSRVTVDTALRWSTDGDEVRLSGTAIVETKTGSAASRADRELWRRGHRPVAFSKYATGLAALRPDLPAAPWRRVLRRHFTAAREELVHG
ncbi:polyphosphate polymerase domain-containing protein [Actinoplanes sp. CA-051413]|uniref:polyphosphate polymerase domain-containing protein n=1 Tax=Actinoplanes sp. CA-051413 TaxID=3239899 RepID=UPI003D99A5A7